MFFIYCYRLVSYWLAGATIKNTRATRLFDSGINAGVRELQEIVGSDSLQGNNPYNSQTEAASEYNKTINKRKDGKNKRN